MSKIIGKIKYNLPLILFGLLCIGIVILASVEMYVFIEYHDKPISEIPSWVFWYFRL